LSGFEVSASCPSCRAVFRTAFARCPLDGAALESGNEDPLVGMTFAERYVIEACAGEGAMGRVYRARHHRVSRQFAVKVLFGEHAADAKMRARFAREAEAASRLSHPNVVPVLDFGETPAGVLYLVMDFVQGPALSEVIDREGGLAAARVRSLLVKLCLGLAHAHDRGVVHRDFKTDNVLLAAGDEEIPRIADFGIAVLLESGGASSRLTTDGVAIGTPAYMAPEQSTLEPIDHRADLFGLGVCVYEMLAGVLPFEGSPIEIARHNLSDEPPPISERSPAVPGDGELEAIARKLMAKDPADRFQSAREVLAALEGAPANTAAFAGAARARSPADIERPRSERASQDKGQTVLVVNKPRRRRLLAVVAAAALGTAALGGLLAVGASSSSAQGGGDPAREGLAPTALEPDPQPAAAPTSIAADTSVGDAGVDPGPASAEASVADGGAPATVATPPRAERRPRSGGRAGGRAHADGGEFAREVSAEALTVRYRAVGATLQGLGDHPAAESLREAYFNVPYAAALGDPQRRLETFRALRRLEAQAHELRRSL
jgi:eukaryotic-like serine/threonine-protein kinase